MKKTITLIAFLCFSIFTIKAQPTPQPPNPGFETWTGSGATIEPTFYNSNKSGTGLANWAAQTNFQDASIVHSGTYSTRMETINYIGTAVNGVMTSGLVNAPSTNKAEGYIGTIQGANGTNINRIAFNSRPDSLVGWYRYTSGGAGESGKVRAVLHVGHYYDPETPNNNNHPDSTVNKIGEALFITPAAASTWTRFSVPFTYVSGASPQYFLLNCTSSANQMTTVTGSKMWLDDIGVIYNFATVGVDGPAETEQDIKVYAFDHVFYVDFMNRTNSQSDISVFDITGKLVLKQQLSNNKLNSFTVSGLNSGNYVYELTGDNFHKSGKLFIK